MGTVSKIPNLDSGVASPEVISPQDVSSNKTLSLGTSSTASEKFAMANSKDATNAHCNSKSAKENLIITSAQLHDDGIETDDDEEILEESFLERVVGLTEMFPESVRTAASVISFKTKSLCKNMYHLSRQVVWIGVSSSLILFSPVMFEVERYNVEEMVKQDRNRLVLGPGSAMSGAPGHQGLSR